MKQGYCADYEYTRGHGSHRAHFKTLADVRSHIKDAVKDGSIQYNSIKVYHGWDSFKVDVTAWALQPLNLA